MTEAPAEAPLPRAAEPAPGGLDVLLAGTVIVGILAALGLLAFALARTSMPFIHGDRMTLTVLLLLAQNAALLAGVLVVGLRRRTSPWRLIGLRPIGLGRLVLYALAGAVAGLSLGLLLHLGQSALGVEPRTPGAEMLAPDGFSWRGLALMLLVAGVLAPFAEEAVFRGLLFGWLRGWLGVLPAALLSALPFGLVHVELVHVAYAALAGLLLALLYARAGTLWAPVAAHVTINLIAVAHVYLALAQGIPLERI